MDYDDAVRASAGGRRLVKTKHVIVRTYVDENGKKVKEKETVTTSSGDNVYHSNNVDESHWNMTDSKVEVPKTNTSLDEILKSQNLN